MNAPNTIATSATPVHHNALKVLLVDDDSFQLEMISEVMTSLGVSDITTVDSGEQALQHLSGQERFNLMLLDLHMPGMDGFKFMDALTKVGYAGALIIVSGQSDDVMLAATMVAKLRRFTLLGTVHKPVSLAAVSSLLAKLG